MQSDYIIDFGNPPSHFFPLPYQTRNTQVKQEDIADQDKHKNRPYQAKHVKPFAGEIEYTDKPLSPGKDSGSVYWDLYINAIIQKTLNAPLTRSQGYPTGGIEFHFPAGKYHLNDSIFFYDTDPVSPAYGQGAMSVNITGHHTSTQIKGENNAKAIYLTGYCCEEVFRYESVGTGWMCNFWTEGLDICLGVYDEDLEVLHGDKPANNALSHGIWSFYLDKLYVNGGGVIVKRISSDISITDSVFDYGKKSIEILDHVYSVTIQNNHFWNTGQRVRIVHSTERFDWQPFFSKKYARQREGYKRGGIVLITGNRDISPGTSGIPTDEGAFHIENCDEVIFTNNICQDTRQPIDIPPDLDENYGGRLSTEANFCNARAANFLNCKYVNVANNIFGSYWPANTGVVTFTDTHYSTISNNIFTPIAGMNRDKSQLDPAVLESLTDAWAIDTSESCVGVQVANNVVEEIGNFRIARR